MIIGIGLDVVEIARIERLYRRFGRHFLVKILSAGEMDQIVQNPAPYLAGRFAAREAAVKALGTGFSAGITFRQMEILNNISGQPVLRFFGKAEKRFREMGGRRIFCSITHERNLASAIVVLEG